MAPRGAVGAVLHPRQEDGPPVPEPPVGWSDHHHIDYTRAHQILWNPVVPILGATPRNWVCWQPLPTNGGSVSLHEGP